MINQIQVPSKDVTERLPLIWVLENPNLIISNVTVTCTTERGIDPTPYNVLVGTPTITGTKIVQFVQGGVSGVLYRIYLTGTLLDGTIFTFTTFLPVQNIA